jgi:hypothetical protein
MKAESPREFFTGDTTLFCQRMDVEVNFGHVECHVINSKSHDSRNEMLLLFGYLEAKFR